MTVLIRNLTKGTVAPTEAMGCKKKKPRDKPKAGRYRCDDCGAVVKKKDEVCDPKKIKK